MNPSTAVPLRADAALAAAKAEIVRLRSLCREASSFIDGIGQVHGLPFVADVVARLNHAAFRRDVSL